MTIQAELEAILTCLESIGQPLSIGALQNHLAVDMPKKTLQRRLKKLVEHGQVIADGEKKARTYRLASYGISSSATERSVTESLVLNEKGNEYNQHPIFSAESLTKLAYLDTPPYGRTKSTYQRQLVEQYTPNKTFYVPLSVRH